MKRQKACLWGYNRQVEWPIQFEIHIVFSNISISTRFGQHREIGIVSAYQGHWNNRKTDLRSVGLLQRLVILQFSLHNITFRNVYDIKLFILTTSISVHSTWHTTEHSNWNISWICALCWRHCWYKLQSIRNIFFSKAKYIHKYTHFTINI